MPAPNDKPAVEKALPATEIPAAKEMPQDPLKQLQGQVEKKIRNLEKRKGKLDQMRKEDVKSLNDDQKKAVSKFDDVIEHLDFFRDFSKSIQKLSDEATKERKRMEKEQAKKARDDKNRFRNVLILQHVLNLVGDQSVRSALLTGAPGMEPLTEERLKKIDQFKESVSLSGKNVSEENFVKQTDAVVDRLTMLVDGKKRDAVKGLSYADLRDMLLSIHRTGLAAVSINSGTKATKSDPAPDVPTAAAAPPPQPQPQSQPQPQELAESVQPAVYSFGTVPGVDARPDQDPAVVSIIPGFANGSIPSQIYTNPSYSGVFVPVTGAVVAGGHMLPSGQLIAPHFQSQQPASDSVPGGQQFDQPPVDQATFEVSNLNLNDAQPQSGENEFRQKDSRRKFPSHGFRRDDRPNKSSDFHGASNGFQRKHDRYQGNNRDGKPGVTGDRKPPRGRGNGPRNDRPSGAPRAAAPVSSNAPAKQW